MQLVPDSRQQTLVVHGLAKGFDVGVARSPRFFAPRTPDELETGHQPDTPDIADGGMASQLLELREEVGSLFGAPGDEILAEEYLEVLVRRGCSDGMTTLGQQVPDR